MRRQTKTKTKTEAKVKDETKKKDTEQHLGGLGAGGQDEMEAYTWQALKCGSFSDCSSGGTLRPRKNQKRPL